MKTVPEIKKLWTCTKCGRQFQRQGQTHSCRPFPLKEHLEGKPLGKSLYEKLKQEVKRQIGPFKIESLECCIHFVKTFTFAAVKVRKNKIRIDFSLHRKIKSKRIKQFVQMSAHRYLYVIDIMNEQEVDREVIEWIEEAYEKTPEEKAVNA